MELFSEFDGCGAEFSEDELYRYTLTRQWDDGPCVGWIMFNPSTATAIADDATIRKCIGFSRRWGYGRMVVLNLYAIRSSDPKSVKRMGPSAEGPLNDYWILQSLRECREVIFAWGCAQHAPDIVKRIQKVCELIDSKNLYLNKRCLGYRKDGHPRHPLILAYDTPREDFIWQKASENASIAT